MKFLENDYNNNTSVVKHTCGFLFALFSFCYLFFIQGEMIAKAQFVFSNAATKYSLLWGAVIITIILRLLQIPVARFSNIPLKFHALSYTPSFLILAVICDISANVKDGLSLGWWWIGIPLILVLMFFLVKLLINFYNYESNINEKAKRASLFITNFFILLMAMLWCSTCNSSTDVDIYEQKTERLIEIGELEEALTVGNKSLKSNRRLTNLRMYALSRLGLLPERLFDYPQYYGINGLVCLSDTDTVSYRIDTRDICKYLGVGNNTKIISTEQFLMEVLNNQQIIVDSLMGLELSRSNNPDSLKNAVGQRLAVLKEEKRRVDDYMLCGLLLERDLERFKLYVNKAYGLNVNSDSIVPVTNLPKAYREALVMVYPNIGDTVMLEKYSEYLDLKKELKDSVVVSNQTRKHFGNTFWWYYDNPRVSIRQLK